MKGKGQRALGGGTSAGPTRRGDPHTRWEGWGRGGIISDRVAESPHPPRRHQRGPKTLIKEGVEAAEPQLRAPVREANPPYSLQDIRVRVRCRPVWGQPPKPGTSPHRQRQQCPPRPNPPPNLLSPTRLSPAQPLRGTIPYPPAIQGCRQERENEVSWVEVLRQPSQQ